MTHSFKILVAGSALLALSSIAAVAGGAAVATGPTTPPQGATATETSGGTVSRIRGSYDDETGASSIIF